jgi:hypothetical protein
MQEFNTAFYSDDPDDFGQAPRKRKLPSIFGALLLLVGGTYFVQTTLAANISLNTGAPVEFGQGVTQAVACDSDGIIFTPTYKFMNNIDLPDFIFDGFKIDGVSDNCENKKFTIKVYDLLTNSQITSVHPFAPRNKITFFFDNSGWHTANQQCPAIVESELRQDQNRVEISFTSCFDSSIFNTLVNVGVLQSTEKTTTFTVESSDSDIAQINIYQPEPEFQPFGITYYPESGSDGGIAYWTSLGQWGQEEHYFELSEINSFRLTLKITNQQFADAVNGVSISDLAYLNGSVSCVYQGVAPQGANFPDGRYPGLGPIFPSEVYDCSFTGSDDMTITHSP